MYLQVGDIEFRADFLEQLCSVLSSLWNTSERGLAKLMYRLGLAMGLWGEGLLWLVMLGKLRAPT